MEVQFGPNPVDEPNLLYKLQRKIKVFNTENPLPNRGYNLVASSSKYCLVFVGSPDGTLSAYHTKDLIDKDCEAKHLPVKLQESPTHIAVSCDDELLAVTGGQLLCFYQVTEFKHANVCPAITLKLDVNPSTFVCALQWNPCIPDNIALAFFDGTLLVSSVASNAVKKVQSKARCICWSPKGKQLVTGNSDGSLCQFKPDLTLAKTVPAPKLFEGAPVEALAIYWISTYQFAVVFRNAADNSRPVVTIVNTPKGGQLTCLNYEDICYSMGTNRPWYYYLLGIAQWNVILASSSNSMEMATLGSKDGANWTQWCQSDEARPELPLTNKKIENYPVGICIDSCGIHQLPWGENETLPHMPLLHVLSQSGLLIIFNIVNLNFEQQQVCIPPQQLTPITLPQNAVTSELPGEAPTQVTLPPPPSANAAPKPQAPVAAQPTPQPVPSLFAPAAGQVPSMFGQANAKPYVPAYVPAATPQAEPPKPKQPEVKSAAPTPQPQPTAAQPKPQPQASKPQASEANAALKAEQEKMNKLKADQELKNMLVKEVNDFQMELYKFVVRTREVQIKLQQDLNSINPNFNFQSLDTEQLKKECDLEDLRNAIVQLKLELVRACAIVAEARTHAEAKDLHQWTQVDPLTSKRVASVKNLAYYVQSELEKAHKALDHKWNQMMNTEAHFNKPGQRMIRPILDDVYQPLVKQQEILSRQQAVLRQLRSTLTEVDAHPLFKTTSTQLLRNTPFKKDPLSKLTKNILNMSIEPQVTKSKDALFTPQKLDALRDMLSNHKPIKIKPVNVELRHHLTQMRLSYERSVKQKQEVKTEPVVPPQPAVRFDMPQPIAQPFAQPVIPSSNIVKPDLVSKPAPISIPSFTPTNQSVKPGLDNVARTLFTDDKTTPSPQQIQSKVQPQFSFASPSMTASADTKSILKDMLQNKQANDVKSDANTFMGQRICSPFAFTPTQSEATQPPSMISKPISEINNMFNKFTPNFTSEPKPKPQPKAQSGEAGQPQPKPIETKKDSPGLFQVKSTTSPPKTIVPDILRTNQSAVNVETAKPVKAPEKSKENVPEKVSENVVPNVPKNSEVEKKDNAKFSFGNTKPAYPLFGNVKITPVPTESPKLSETKAEPKSEVKPEAKPKTKLEVKLDSKPEAKPENKAEVKPENKAEVKPETKLEPKPETKLEAKPEIKTEAKLETKPEAKPVVAKETPKPEPVTPSSNASSIFAAANAATPPSPKPESPTTTPQSIFSSTQPTAATEAKTTKEAATTSASSIFASAASQPFAKTTQSGSIFSSPSSASSVFGSQGGSIFGTATTTQSSPSALGTSPPQTTVQSVFGGTEAKSSVFSTPAAVFASAAAATPPSTPIKTPTQPAFGSQSQSGSIFAATTTTQSPVFGTGSVFATTTTAQSVFGAATTTTQSVFGLASSSSIFSGAAATTPTSVFGSPATTAQSVFGTTTATTQASIFGAPTTTQASIFGTTTPTTQASVFGSTTQTSVFGTTTPTTQASVFGIPTTTQTSVFGTPTPTTQASVFGSQPTTTASGSIFGGADNLFAAASISTTSASSTGSIFGGGSTGSVFGSGGSSPNVFGKTTSFNQSNPQAAAIFGSGTSFGQKPATDFWSGGSSTAGTGFGSAGFGQQATTQSSSIFGGSTGGSFSSPSTGQAFGSPQQTVFGTQQAAPAFGGSPVFGSKPAFGQAAAFGSPPSGGGGFGSFGGFNKSPTSGGFGAPAAFGGPPAFGGSAFGGTSPGKVFGGAAPAPSFAATQSNATFEQLATQNTLTFGNLAQQSGPQAQPAPSFNASPSFTGWRG